MGSTHLTRHLKASRSDVFRALLDPEAVQQWMVPDGMTSEVHEFEAREGGVFRISLTYDDPQQAGKTSGATDTFRGRFAKVVPDSKIVQVVEFQSDDPAMQGEMTITYLLEDRDGGTNVTGIHEDLPSGLSVTDNKLGWSMSMGKLAKLVERR
jgi:uncharacterized protein YndB with AHSA1/START domain